MTRRPSPAPGQGRRGRGTAEATARATRAVARRVETLFGTGGAVFRILAKAHAASTAGDTLVAIALAQSLFFAVPTGEARGNVVGYLLLTVAPFALIGPLLGALLDHRGSATVALVASSALRALGCALLVWQQSALWLFPVAFALLVLSRVHGISRSALLPVALDEPVALVSANARLAQVGVLAGALVAPAGALAARFSGSAAVLLLAAGTFVVATAQAFRLPAVGAPTRRVSAGARRRLRRERRARERGSLPGHVRFAQLATATVRLLNGFLVLLLAFAFRDQDAPLLDFGAALAAAGAGFGLSSLLAPALEERLREEPMVVAALAVEAAAAFIAGQWFGLAAAAALSLAAGFAWGTAKFAFDGLLQGAVPASTRGRAFTRSETVFQLAWVLGALAPTAVPIAPHIGLVLAGLTALIAQTVYMGRLLQRIST